jgi:transcription antitermination factor NusB
MRKRTQAREFALQILYQLDITRDDCAESLSKFWENNSENQIEEVVKEFACDLVKGIQENLPGIDAKISHYAQNWQLERMAVVDRNILRIGCYELLFRRDIPPKASINEAVEIAKRYSGVEAGKFVNAILDKVKQEEEA